MFGAEILVITPWVVFVGKDNAPYVAFLVFFLVLFLSVIYSKIVDSKYLSFSVKDGDDKNEKPMLIYPTHDGNQSINPLFFNEILIKISYLKYYDYD